MDQKKALMERIRLFVLDLDGTVYLGDRLLPGAADFITTAKEKGFGVIIAAAGMAAHLAGAMAAGTTLPVIGIPIKSEQLGGLDALLSTVQMPSGIPVATVAIDGAKNAAVLAVEILALSDEELSAKLEKFRADGTAAALKKDAAINNK